jgi:hypothetical protein
LPQNDLHKTHTNVVAIIIGCILGTIVFLLLILLILQWRVKRSRNQHTSEYSFEPPLYVGPGTDPDHDRPRGEGSPRISGGETDPFLTRSTAGANEGPEMQEADTARLLTLSDPPPEGTPGDAAARHARISSDSSSTGSGYGSLINRPPVIPPEEMRGHIVPPADLLRMEHEHSNVAPSSYSPLLPPPRLDPDRLAGGRISHHSQRPSQRSLNSQTDAEEAATLYTARRVRISSPHASHMEGHVPSGGSSGLAASLGLGLGALAGLSRLSWFKNIDPPFRRRSRTSSYISRPLSDHEVEAGQAMLNEPPLSHSRLEAGTSTDVNRPVSGISATSGNTIYYDTHTSPPVTPDIAPPPRAFAPTHQSRPSSGTGFAHDSIYEYEGHILDSHSPTQSNLDFSFPPGVDVLDIPAPLPASPFASSASSRGSMGPFPLPPLLPNFRSQSDGTTSVGVGARNSDGVTIDVLEEEPPVAEDRWRSIASAGPAVVEVERRTTFGTVSASPFIHYINTQNIFF